ncbi:hypothetical protein BH10PLA2_BH10PLA2_06430 [soil metagenome]
MRTDSPLAPFILTGMARSGTTYFGELANRYLDIAAINEGTFEFWLYDQDCRPETLRDESTYRDLLQRFADHIYFHFLFKKAHSIDQVVSELLPLIRERSRIGIARATLELARQRWQKPRLGHEDPVFMYHLDRVVDMYPGCKVIQIVRDPRDVTASVLQFPWGPNNAVVAADDWNRLVTKARKLGSRLGTSRYLEFRYEDLLTHPRETMSLLQQFVTGTVDEARVEAFVRETDVNPLRANFGNWKKGLSPEQVRLVEAAAHEQMADFGYRPQYVPGELSTTSRKIWRLHHRAVQVRNILVGKLHPTGLGKIDPPAPPHGPKRISDAKQIA